MSHWLRSCLRRLPRWFQSQHAPVRTKRSPQLTCESLEPRVLMSAKALGGLTAFPTALVADDRFEDNDAQSVAADLGLITGSRTFNGLVLNDDDWYRFTTSAAGITTDVLQVNFLHRRGDIDVELRDAAGNLVGNSNGTSSLEKISLYELSARTYFVRVFGYRGATNPSYSLRIQSAGNDDRFEPNDARESAKDLGTLTKGQNFTDLQGLDDDWYSFTTTRIGTNASFVQIGFDGSQGDLDLRLFDQFGTFLDASNGTGNTEFLSLEGRPAGTYYARVNLFSGNGVLYDLSLAPPNASDAEHTVFMNFDGAALTRADLNRWAGNGGNGLNAGEWFTGLSDPTNGLDDDNNGIDVSPFWEGSLDREQVIAGVLQNMNTDLQAFGVQAVRHFGVAVEGVEATTLFLGPSTLTNGNYHVACSIDEGNNDRTDIAFIGNDDVRNDLTTTSRKVLAVSDVALHEAGHTFGLYHVQSGSNTETMGLRYNTSTNRWLQNTSFQNRTYALREISGRYQNSYQYMRDTFVLNLTPSPAGNGVSLLAADMLASPLASGGDAVDFGGLPAASPLMLPEHPAAWEAAGLASLTSPSGLTDGRARRR